MGHYTKDISIQEVFMPTLPDGYDTTILVTVKGHGNEIRLTVEQAYELYAGLERILDPKRENKASE